MRLTISLLVDAGIHRQLTLVYGFSLFFQLLVDVGDFDTEFFQVQNLRFAMRSTITSVAIAVWLVAACRCAFMAPTVAVAAYRIT
tara:strand:- start:226 stop:480 length:255 start_codon:yes stop_codon:yes gene_type:complete